jgi:acyl dehydratase
VTARVVWADIVVPAELPDLVDDPMTYERVVMNPGATWDYFPGHFDPEYARAQGQPSIFVNTMHVAGFVDRAATEWSGPYGRVVRRALSLGGSIYAGDTMTARRRITAKRRESGRWLVDLHVDVLNQRGQLCCPSDVTVDVSRALSQAT